MEVVTGTPDPPSDRGFLRPAYKEAAGLLYKSLGSPAYARSPPSSGATPRRREEGEGFRPPLPDFFLVPASPLCELNRSKDTTTLFRANRIYAKQFYYLADQPSVPAE